MKDRILYGWTFQRGFYLVAGLLMIIISALNQEWVGVAVGSYFGAMGLFAFGCAGGQCYTGKFPSPAERESKSAQS